MGVIGEGSNGGMGLSLAHDGAVARTTAAMRDLEKSMATLREERFGWHAVLYTLHKVEVYHSFRIARMVSKLLLLCTNMVYFGRLCQMIHHKNNGTAPPAALFFLLSSPS